MPFELQAHERYIGLMGLVADLDLEVPFPAVISIVGSGTRKTHEKGGYRVERYPVSYARDTGVWAALKFAMRYEPVDLRILRDVFVRLLPDDLAGWIRGEPTGIYSRRVWFFYEFLTGRKLDLEDAPSLKNEPALDPKKHFGVDTGQISLRHRIINNLPGPRGLCPIVRRTKNLERFIQFGARLKARNLLQGVDPAILTRAVDYLYTKETRSTFEIEGAQITPDRSQRFVLALRDVEQFQVDTDSLVRLQNMIMDPRYRDSGWRNGQVYIGETGVDFRERVHCIFPKSDDVPGLMDAWMALEGRVSTATRSGSLDAVIAAALVAFSFVFIHPFGDGNGRVHRFLIHRTLAQAGFTPKGILFPVSAVIARDRHAYDVALETVSGRIMRYIDWEWSRGDTGEVLVKNATDHLYRYFDATALAEYLYDCVLKTITTDLRDEIAFITIFDAALRGVMERVDMPDRKAGLFVRLCLQNNGRLGQNKRADHFPELTDQEVADLETIVATARGQKNKEET